MKYTRDDLGVCSVCKEWTYVLEPCCDAAVMFEGGLVHIKDIEEEEKFQAAIEAAASDMFDALMAVLTEPGDEAIKKVRKVLKKINGEE